MTSCHSSGFVLFIHLKLNFIEIANHFGQPVCTTGSRLWKCSTACLDVPLWFFLFIYFFSPCYRWEFSSNNLDYSDILISSMPLYILFQNWFDLSYNYYKVLTFRYCRNLQIRLTQIMIALHHDRQFDTK